jgi:hypothetical protein
VTQTAEQSTNKAVNRSGEVAADVKWKIFRRRPVTAGDYEVLGLQVAIATGFGISSSTW